MLRSKPSRSLILDLGFPLRSKTRLGTNELPDPHCWQRGCVSWHSFSHCLIKRVRRSVLGLFVMILPGPNHGSGTELGQEAVTFVGYKDICQPRRFCSSRITIKTEE